MRQPRSEVSGGSRVSALLHHFLRICCVRRTMPLHQQEEFTKLPRVIFTHKRHDIIEKSVDLRIFVVFHERDPVADLSVSVMRDESRIVDQLPQTAFQVGEQPAQILFTDTRKNRCLQIRFSDKNSPPPLSQSRRRWGTACFRRRS